MLKISVLFLSAALLSGCGSLDVGASKFGCSGMPEGVKCMSAKEVYSATDSSDHVNGEVAERWLENKAGKAEASSIAKGVIPIITPAADKPTPIRHPAKIMRIWVNSYEDDDTDLYAGQYVFTEIEPRKWSIGSEKGADTGSTSPLSSKSRNTIRETESPLKALTK